MGKRPVMGGAFGEVGLIAESLWVRDP